MSARMQERLERLTGVEHALRIGTLPGALSAECSCGGWGVPVLEDGIDYRPAWEEHLSHSSDPDQGLRVS